MGRREVLVSSPSPYQVRVSDGVTQEYLLEHLWGDTLAVLAFSRSAEYLQGRDCPSHLPRRNVSFELTIQKDYYRNQRKF